MGRRDNRKPAGRRDDRRPAGRRDRRYALCRRGLCRHSSYGETKMHERVAFLTSRADFVDPRLHRKTAKGRELNPKKFAGADWHGARAREWAKHLDHDVFEIRPDLDAEQLKKEGKNVLSMRYVHTDKNEMQRGEKS